MQLKWSCRAGSGEEAASEGTYQVWGSKGGGG